MICSSSQIKYGAAEGPQIPLRELPRCRESSVPAARERQPIGSARVRRHVASAMPVLADVADRHAFATRVGALNFHCRREVQQGASGTLRPRHGPSTPC